jgi:hypothetical protein
VASEFPDIPHDMRRVYQRFERWRSAHTGRLPIPERLWAAAAELARQHGVFATAKALRLEYGKLKQLADAPVPALKGRVAKAPTALRQTPVITRHRTTVPRGARLRPRPPAFVELLAPGPGSSRECRVELEGPRGRMRIEFKGIAIAELVALSRALWDDSAPTDQGEA